jgi:hypothetical protein
MIEEGDYWAKIKHTGELEVVQITGAEQINGRCSVTRTGCEQLMDLDQVEIISPVVRPREPVPTCPHTGETCQNGCDEDSACIGASVSNEAARP